MEKPIKKTSHKRKIGTIVADIFFSYVFFVSTIMIAFVINSFFTISGQELPNPIKFLVDNRVYTISILVVWLITCFLKSAYDDTKNKIDEMKYLLKEKERQIEISSGMLEAKYGDFAEYINDARNSKILSLAIARYPFIEACHLYNYELHRSNSHVRIKIKFNLGEEQECTSINVIKQNYYDINKEVYLQIKKLLSLNSQDSLSKITKEFATVTELIEKSGLHQSMRHRLNEVIISIFCKITNMDGVGIEDNPDSHVNDSFRTGIIGSILTEHGYIYKYKRDKVDKKGRVYYATPIILGSDYLLNIIIDGQGMNNSELNSTLVDVATFIHNEYNKSIGGQINE